MNPGSRELLRPISHSVLFFLHKYRDSRPGKSQKQPVKRLLMESFMTFDLI